MFNVSWESIALITVGLIAYWRLLGVTKRQHVLGLVELFVETSERDESGEFPKLVEIFCKACPFLVTPVPGMEFLPAGLESAQIVRVKTEDQGLLEVICEMKISNFDQQFEDTCKQLERDGWRKKTWV